MASRTGEPSPPKRVTVKVVILGCMNVGKTSLMKRYASNKFTGKRQVTTGTDFVTKSVELNGQPVRLQLWDTAGQERFAKGTLGNSFYRGTDGALLVYDLNSQHTFDQVNLWREELLSKMGDDIDPRTFPVVVVGNKLDILEDRARVAAEAKAKAAAEAKTAEEGGDAGGDDGDSETKATTPRSEGGAASSGGVPAGDGAGDGEAPVDRELAKEWCSRLDIGHIDASAKDGTGVQAAVEAIAMLAIGERERRAQAQERTARESGSSTSSGFSKTSSTPTTRTSQKIDLRNSLSTAYARKESRCSSCGGSFSSTNRTSRSSESYGPGY